ncbi:MAG: AAA family ATPase [Labilithrix sp.]|nr:AAA family ATPase [Labilithrix sp.]
MRNGEIDGSRVTTGSRGLDDVLGGGLPEDRMYLVHGLPGVGKTTLALQFLLEGVRRGEKVLYVTLSETEHEIRQVADSHGWSLDGITLYELSAAEQNRRLNDNTLYAAEDVELKETMSLLLDQVVRTRPARVVFDSLSEIRLLAQSGPLYRREILGLKQFFAGRNCTVLLLDDRSAREPDLQVESLAHGVIALEQSAREYGSDRRRLRVVKLRGSSFRSGYHDFVVRRGGLVVFPRLVAAEHRSDEAARDLPSGVPELDTMLGGGLDRATSTLIVGPAGSGKSLLATQFVAAAAARGENATLFLFEERSGTLRRRTKNLGIDLDAPRGGRITIRQVDPAELAPDEFTHLVRDEVEANDSRVIVIDSINGYFTAMPEERFMTLHMHELLAYLDERGVATILTMSQGGVVGTMTSPIDVSYLSDTVILLRYYEHRGRVRKAISVLKKRSGAHEDAIRQLTFGSDGVRLGEPLSEMRGVLTGVPVIEGPDGRPEGPRVD